MTPLFERALKGEATERFPVWMMRQAGRYLPGYRAIRAKTPFLELCRTPELAAEVTLEPIELFDMDAAIVFADILLTADAMGVEVAFPNGGPKIQSPVRTEADVERVHDPDPSWMTSVAETVRILRRELPAEKALIGFSAAPFTLCAYMVEGGTSRDFWQTRAFAHANPAAFRRLLEKVADALVPYLQAQVEAGAGVLQLFDTWAGMADASLYRTAVLPAIERVLAGLGPDRVPVILFAGIGCSHRLELAAGTGVEGVSLDWATNLADAYARVGDRVRLQGNLDPTVLLSSPEHIQAEMDAMLGQVPAGKTHLVNLGHGVLKETPPEHVAVFAKAAQTFRPEALTS
ncbi:MAG: uroporphyrinogen decarboxylase [Planctomycetota bacterium]|nr:uroporphyrinogen decarboxylase [Planctomycetota bacterium]